MRPVWRLLIEGPDTTLPWMRENGRIGIGWGEIGDTRELGTEGAIAEAIRHRNETHPDHAGRPAANVTHGTKSVYDFCYEMRPGDLAIIAVSGKSSERSTRRRREVCEVIGDYEHVAPENAPLNYQHQRVARRCKRDPDELWQQAGGLAEGQIAYRTLARCANAVE